MNTVILALALSAVSVAGIVFATKYYKDWLFGLSLLVLLVGFFVALIFGLILMVETPQEMAVFERQKAYIEAISPDGLQNTGAIISKTEQNEWLYGAQFNRERFGNWSVYPESVLELEPIK